MLFILLFSDLDGHQDAIFKNLHAFSPSLDNTQEEYYDLLITTLLFFLEITNSQFSLVPNQPFFDMPHLLLLEVLVLLHQEVFFFN
jgi:hypothetical protein